MSSIDVSGELLRAIAENLNTPGNEHWESYSAVIDPDKDEDWPVSRTSALVYSAEGYLAPAGLKPHKIGAAVWAFMVSHYTHDEQWPIRLLVQYNRKSGQYNVSFEESDTSRWRMTPNNMDAIREELRPFPEGKL